eukprot:SAG11_NODE_12579_length_696_cov_1.187605_1_plen_88_part_10
MPRGDSIAAAAAAADIRELQREARSTGGSGGTCGQTAAAVGRERARFKIMAKLEIRTLILLFLPIILSPLLLSNGYGGCDADGSGCSL